MTKIMQGNDTTRRCRRLQWNRVGGRRHLINVRQNYDGTDAICEANGTKRKNECGMADARMYFFTITHRKHSLRLGVKVLEAVVEAGYTTDIQMKGRLKEKYGLRSPQGEQLLPGAQRAQGRQGETNSPGEAGRASDHHRSSGARSKQEASVRGVELACVARTSEQQQPDRLGGFRFAGGAKTGWGAARVEPGTRGPVC